MDRITANTAISSSSTATATSTEKTEGKGEVFAALFQSVSGEQKQTEDLKDVPLTNEQLAMLLQQFGATPALLTVLMENPEGNPVQTLAAHPELLADLGKVITNVMGAAVVEPNVIQTEAKLSNIMKSVMAELNGQSQQQQVNVQDTQTQAQPKAQVMLGKLQATMSSHIFRSVAVVEQTATTTETAEEAGKAEGSILNTTPVTAQAAQINPLQRTVQPTMVSDVVTVKAENLTAELPDMIIKRASLIEAPGRHDFRIILEPQGLGEIEIRVQKIGNQISLQIAADNVTTKGLLDSGIASLKAQLQVQGIQYDRIEVTNNSGTGMGELNSGFSQERGSRGGAQEQSNREAKNPVTNEAFSIDGTDSVTPEVPTVDSDGIDVSA